MGCSPFIVTRSPSPGSTPGGTAGEVKQYEICCTKTYAQTLFLGCSIKSFNASLGWGGEASRLTVELIYDNCAYPILYDQNKNTVLANDSPNDYINKLSDNSFQKDENGNSLIPAKVYYEFDANSGDIVSRYWSGADPGFYGEMPNSNYSIEIVGCAVYFKYDYFEFAGVVKSWERSGGQSGQRSYTVNIEVPTFLLSQTQMILGDYIGSIHTKWPGSTYGTPSYNVNNYIGDIYEQNLPNIINVYGFLEDITPYETGVGATPVTDNGTPYYSYGASGRTEEGIPAFKVLEGIVGLLDSIDPFNKDKVLRYSPFGRIVGPAPRIKNTYEEVDWSIPDYGMGLVMPHSYPSNSNQSRMFYTVDVSAFYGVLSTYRISDNKMNIMDFAQNLADNFGYKLFVSMKFIIDNGILYPRLVFNTITTKVQPPDGAIANFISTVANLGSPVTQYTTGEEYNDNSPKRTMIIGGKQQRLYQIKNSKYSLRQSTLRYNPYSNQFLSNPHSGAAATQKFKLPDPNSTRSPTLYSGWSPALAIGRVRIPIVEHFQTGDAWETVDFINSTLTKRGNYYPVVGLPPIGVVSNGTFPSADSDAICPYFGNNLITGVVRNVTSHISNNHHGIGFFIEFTTDELSLATGTRSDLNWIDTQKGLAIGNQVVRVSETEIRAAMKGLDSYLGLLSFLVSDGQTMYGSSFKLDIYDKVIFPILGPLSLTLSQGITNNYDKYTNSQTPTQNVPNSPKSYALKNPAVYDLISKLQQFFKQIGDEYYGKQFMVSIPTPQYWVDTSTGLLGYDAQLQIGVNNDGTPIMLTSGSLKVYYQYEPTDTAWEEPYNIIDDTLVIGSPNADPILNDDGSIPPLVGYNNSWQFNYDALHNIYLYTNTRNKSTNQNFNEFTKFDAAINANIVSSAQAQTDDGDLTNNNNFWVPSLTISNDKDGQTIVNYQTAAVNAGAGFAPNQFDAFGNFTVPPEKTNKIYKKADVSKKYESHYVLGILVPKLIIKTDGMFINPISPKKLSLRTAATEWLLDDYNNYGDLALIRRAQKVISANASYQFPGQSTPGVNNFTNQNNENDQFNNLAIHPKAAIPNFIGIPLVFNDAIYGPWISSPDLVIDGIFPNDSDLDFKKRKLENLAGGVNLEINNDLVPWNYGGMRVLDEAAILLASANNDYQTKGESGQLSLYGVPNKGLGSQLYAPGTQYGPIINNVQVQVGENGPLTTYTLRTFTRKFTLFNKENADRLKAISQNSIKLNKELRSRFNEISARLKEIQMGGASFDAGDKSKFESYSPLTILVGYSKPYVSPREQNENRGFFPRPQDNSNLWTGNSIKQKITVGVQDLRELSQEFENLYSTKSFMSMDGIFHPVSFYPTILGSTTPYKRYFTGGCQICGGTKSFSLTFSDGSEKTLYCDNCSDKLAGKEVEEIGNAGSAPPFILSDAADASIIQNPNALNNLLQNTLLTKRINYVNLNPVIMPVGELRNKYAQDSDYTAHSIEAVGRSQVPMAGSISVSDNLNIPQNGLEYADQNRFDSDVDWNSYAFDQFIGRNPPALLQMNQRFMALRGPLVIAGWGFDTEGYPVPNASGEPQELDNEGYPKRIASPADDTGGFQDYPGTILGKNQQWDDDKGQWSDPIKEDKFYKGWGLRSDLWPVGPVDLRWDHNRKVWTCPSPYKIVDVQLEDNLIPPFPARGFLDRYDKETPLPNDLRRMVFVRDSGGTFGAPRGAKLTCYYDESSGFYEVINKQNIIAKGYIKGNGVASIINAYASGFTPTGDPEPIENISVEFENFLGFTISSTNQPGIFMWIKDVWVLISTNNCG